jgi:serine/threonine protein kinase/formylglycine-generating enzyme required for sulfatase activity
MQELQQLRPGDSFAARYRVLRLIRAGGMGAVYEVEDTSTRRRRALKLMHPSLVQSADSRMRFEREVFIGAELETEHVVEVIDAGLDQASQVPFLTMELLRGEELGDLLERVGRLGPVETIGILVQLSRALDKAHGKGIVHRDLKPENVFLTAREDGSIRAKILDFGIAKLVEGAQTSATQAAGTPLYMAPEQTEKLGHVSPATDVWAIGLVSYRMLVGHSYWQGDSLQQLYRQILIDPLVSPVERAMQLHGVPLPPAFDQWWMRTVARHPHERYQQVGVCVGELARVFGVAPTGHVAIPGIAGSTTPEMRSYPQQGATPTSMSDGSSPSFPAMTPGTPLVSGAYAQPGYSHEPSAPSAYGGTALSPVPGTMPTPAGVVQTASAPIGSTASAALIPAAPERPSQATSGGRGGLLIALTVVGIVALGAGGYALFGGGGGTGSGGKTNGGDTPEPTAKPKPKPEEPKPDPDAWRAQIEKLNPMLEVAGRDFDLAKHEVTRAEFAIYLASPAGKKGKKPLEDFETLAPDAKDGKLPVTWVTYEAAEQFCTAIGGRVPTAEEWDAAVAGPDKRKFPWGNTWPAAGSDNLRDLAVGKPAGTGASEVDSSPYDVGPYGHRDLAGNVQEWTSTDTEQGKKLRGTDVTGDQSQFLSPGELFTEAKAPPGAANVAKASAEVGFRCARDHAAASPGKKRKDD